ncbi:PfkB family carbohydrate kinase [Phenylobacterium sp.]|uniref:PfkB family carbohydrate kinase n=1 Tax=Phenylobacterium sp. TaxID=1871053 RepID=UPI00286B1140|nr:PfkB family carbohydrate kinase [Phenylobacterium sp.]
MPVALILSSYVAADRIGGGAQQLALAACGIDPILLPTVLLGRSPAKGGRGQPVEAELLQDLLDGVEAAGVFDTLDLLVTGHFSSPYQVMLACQTIRRVRAANPAVIVVVDPVLGDAPKGLYVRPEVAREISQDLVPMADWITPNLWELAHLSGRDIADAAGMVAAVRDLGKPALVTSAPARPGEIGLACCTPEGSTLFAHPRRDQAPNGTGDLVTAIFAAGLAQGLSGPDAAQRAAGAVAMAIGAEDCGMGLPIVALGARMTHPDAPLRVETLA